MKNKFSIAIHGGAGTIQKNNLTAENQKMYCDAMADAIRAGMDILKNGGSSLEAVERAVISLEDVPCFNAGKGSVFTNIGVHEMDAAIMRGDSLDAGAVSGIKNVRNPVSLARAVMEKSNHVFLSADGAEEFARSLGLRFEEDEYFYSEIRHKQWKEIEGTESIRLDHSEPKPVRPSGGKFGTVGAVAMDMNGNLAAATSTGGITNKKFGRVGDSPIIGAGTYANNKTCAVSCTGHGEYFIRAVVAYDISCLMEYKGMSLQQATEFVVNDKLVKFGGDGGLIAVDSKGNISMPYNSEGMYRAQANEEGKIQCSIFAEEIIV